ncbi:epidermal growth factor-like protein [Musca domestica]|nr:epidermal growth factor-like protein [Musca domestica]
MNSSKQFVLTFVLLLFLLIAIPPKSARVKCSRVKRVGNNKVGNNNNELEIQNVNKIDDDNSTGFLQGELPLCTEDEACPNGYCHNETGQCMCHAGFKWDIARKHCLPICEINCDHGQCLKSPRSCECDTGYEFNVISKKCKPVCKSQCTTANNSNPNCKRICLSKCISGKCFSLHHRDRHHYYQNVSINCNANCGFGECLEPGALCQCYEGYVLNQVTQLCEPMCQPRCPRHSRCVLPNVCECNPGFGIDPLSRRRCKPLFSKVFTYSAALGQRNWENSIQLDKIIQIANKTTWKSCSPGYVLNADTLKCQPMCHNNCLNGNCSSPDVCVCSSGYSMNNTTFSCQPNACRIPCSHGYCTPDGDCICSEGYTKSIIRGSGCEPLFNHTLTVVFIFVCIMTIMLVIICLIAVAERRRRRRFL